MTLEQIERRIERIKAELARMGEMRPGALTRQYNVCGVKGCRCKDPVHPKKHGPYLQLSYIHRGKSTTRFIRRHQAKRVRAQVLAYRRFRKLTQDWVHLAIEQAQRTLELTRDEG